MSGALFTVGFDIANTVGSILKYNAATQERSLLTDSSSQLQRPIGILYDAKNATATNPQNPLRSVDWWRWRAPWGSLAVGFRPSAGG